MYSLNRSQVTVKTGLAFYLAAFALLILGLFQGANSSAKAGDNGGPTPPALTTVQFGAKRFKVAESAESATITVTRTGVTTGTTTVDYAVGLDDDDTDTASQRSDFTLTAGTLTFGPSDVLKTFVVLVNRVSTPTIGEKEAKIVLSNVQGTSAALGQPNRVSLEIDDEAEHEHPLDNHRNYVRQQYHDFLNRVPDQGGLDFWTSKLDDCLNETACLEREHREVSAAFYMSAEFQDTGFFVYKLEQVSFNRRPEYLSFIPEVQAISRAAIANGASASRREFAADFSQRAEFKAAYDNLSNAEYIDTLYRNAEVTPDRPVRDRQVDDLNNNRRQRGDVLQDVAEHPVLSSREYNGAFVLMQYFGYLRRNPDEAGYQFWLGKLNDGTRDNYPAMVDAFVKALEYRDRFGAQ
jgi:hypothetical protein